MITTDGQITEVRSFVDNGIHVTEYHYQGIDDHGNHATVIQSVAKAEFDWQDVIGWVGRHISEVRTWHRI